MRILHVIPTIDSRDGGSPIACISLCRELARVGHDVTIFSTFMRGERENWRAYTGDLGSVKVRCFPVMRGSYGLSASLFCALAPAIKAADVVHIHGVYRFTLVAAAWWCRRYAVPYVVKPHGSLDPYVFRVRRWRKWPAEKLLIAPILAHASALHFTAEEEMLRAASSGLFRGSDGRSIFNAVIVPEGVESSASNHAATAEDFSTMFPQTVGKRIILFVGRLNFVKGLDILVKAFAMVFKTFSDTHLVLVGPDNEGYKAEVRRWLEAEDLAPQVTFTGMLSREATAAAYEAATIFVLPSYTESFGLVVCEALSHSLPIVISNRINIWREVAESQVGIITECDASQIAAAIIRVLADPESARAMAERGRLLVRRRFTAKAVSEQMLAVYRQLIDDWPVDTGARLESSARG